MKVFDPDEIIPTSLIWWVFGVTMAFLVIHVYQLFCK